VNAKILELDRTSANKFDVESIRARVITARNQLRDLESRLKKSQQASVTPMQEKQFNGVINDYNKYMSLKSQRENLLSCIVAYNVQLKEADKTVTVLGRDVDTYKERLTSIDKQIDNSKSDAKQWDDYNKAESARAHLLLELDKFDQSMAKTRAAQCTYEKHYEPAQYSEIEDLKSGYLQEINSLERLKANFESGENTECPTCGTAVDEFKDRMTRIAELPILKRKLALADTMLRSSRNYEKFHLDQANCLKEMSQKKAYLQQAIAAVPQVEQPSTEIVDVDKLHNDKKLMLARLFDLTNKLNERIKARNTLEGQLSAAELQIEDIETQLAVFKCPSKEQVEEARLKLVAIPITRAEQSQLVAEIAVIKRGIYDDENLLEEASDDIKKQERLNKWKDTLIAVKDILHRDALPKMVAQSYMNKLESQINKSLEELNIDFRVKSKEDLKFDAIFDDGVREVPVEVLSGGEKVVFSLAWRLAVNAEFANDIGILCLDEPTAGLDRDRLGCLRLAIEQMKLMSRKTGLQCIVITHAEDLMSLFDQVIEFTSPSKL
jgi:DNA repair exonuclease SbcCD ATPase subunit